MERYKNIILIFVFYLFGPIQTLGIIGYYASVIICSVFILLLFINAKSKNFDVSLVLLGTVILVFLTGFLSSSNKVLFQLYYSVYIVPAILVLVLNKISPIVISIKALDVFCVIQLVVVFFQLILSNYINLTTVSSYDMMYGTLNKATDHVLAYSLFCASILYRTKGELGWVRILVIVSTIAMTNSKISFVVGAIVIIFHVIFSIRFYVFILMIILISLIVFGVFYDSIIAKYEAFSILYKIGSTDASAFLFDNAMGNRIAAILTLAEREILIFGNGVFSVYDPLLKKFSVSGDYSLLIWFYYDLGLVGLTYFTVVVYFLVNRNIVLLIIVSLMSIVFTSFSDYPFLFSTAIVGNELKRLDVLKLLVKTVSNEKTSSYTVS